MTDKQDLIDLFSRWGVNNQEVHPDALEENSRITVMAKDGEKVLGYYGFHVVFNFDAGGKFIDLGIWE